MTDHPHAGTQPFCEHQVALALGWFHHKKRQHLDNLTRAKQYALGTLLTLPRRITASPPSKRSPRDHTNDHQKPNCQEPGVPDKKTHIESAVWTAQIKNKRRLQARPHIIPVVEEGTCLSATIRTGKTRTMDSCGRRTHFEQDSVTRAGSSKNISLESAT